MHGYKVKSLSIRAFFAVTKHIAPQYNTIAILIKNRKQRNPLHIMREIDE
jgi:hypothetical protein